MPRVQFNLDGLAADPPTRTATPAPAPVGGFAENIPLFLLPDHLRFSAMGGTPVVFRSGFVRVR